MKKRNMFIIAVIIILLLVLVPVLINRIVSGKLDKIYPEVGTVKAGSGFIITKVPLNGGLQSQPNDSSADYNSSIYVDTVKQNFKVVTMYHKDGNDVTAYTTFDSRGKVLEIQRYVPHQTAESYLIDLETVDSSSTVTEVVKSVKINPQRHLEHCVLLNGVLPPWPKWKDKTSPVYIRHFSKEKLNLSELNPFQLGGINGQAYTAVWNGNAYCDIQFMGRTIKLKIPFGYDSLLFNTNDYYAILQYYTLPDLLKAMQVRIITLDGDVYVINQV